MCWPVTVIRLWFCSSISTRHWSMSMCTRPRPMCASGTASLCAGFWWVPSSMHWSSPDTGHRPRTRPLHWTPSGHSRRGSLNRVIHHLLQQVPGDMAVVPTPARLLRPIGRRRPFARSRWRKRTQQALPKQHSRPSNGRTVLPTLPDRRRMPARMTSRSKPKRPAFRWGPPVRRFTKPISSPRPRTVSSSLTSTPRTSALSTNV